jgi:lysophospholipase L1-like esterase
MTLRRRALLGLLGSAFVPLELGCSRKELPSKHGVDAAGVDHDAPGVIVVLGSSTAAGRGPSEPALAWVERYRAHLKQEFPMFQLVNLAVSGYTTYEMQPTGYAPPPTRASPDTEHNITCALSFRPSALIINMPSNDQGSDIPLTEQLANYERVVTLAQEHGAKVWVTTSQPRNFEERARRDGLMQARDVICEKYRTHCLDFWTPFALEDGHIQPKYDSGDGIHLNDDAHAILVQRVIAARIPEALAERK